MDRLSDRQTDRHQALTTCSYSKVTRVLYWNSCLLQRGMHPHEYLYGALRSVVKAYWVSAAFMLHSVTCCRSPQSQYLTDCCYMIVLCINMNTMIQHSTPWDHQQPISFLKMCDICMSLYQWEICRPAIQQLCRHHPTHPVTLSSKTSKFPIVIGMCLLPFVRCLVQCNGSVSDLLGRCSLF